MTQPQIPTKQDLNRWFKNEIVKAGPTDSRDYFDWRTPVDWATVVPANYMEDFIAELSRTVSTSVYELLTDEQYKSNDIVSQEYSKAFLFSSPELRARVLYKVMTGA